MDARWEEELDEIGGAADGEDPTERRWMPTNEMAVASESRVPDAALLRHQEPAPRP